MRILLLLMCMVLGVGLFAQDSTIIDVVDIKDPLTVDILQAKYIAIASVVITLLGLLQKWLFPEKLIPEVATRAVIIAAVVGILAFEYDILSSIGVLITWITSILFYEKGLKPLGLQTPKTELQKELKKKKLVKELEEVGVTLEK